MKRRFLICFSTITMAWIQRICYRAEEAALIALRINRAERGLKMRSQTPHLNLVNALAQDERKYILVYIYTISVLHRTPMRERSEIYLQDVSYVRYVSGRQTKSSFNRTFSLSKKSVGIHLHIPLVIIVPECPLVLFSSHAKLIFQ